MADTDAYRLFENSLVEDDFCDDPFEYAFYSAPSDPFVARNGLPHVMVSLAIGYSPNDEALNRPELLTILAITISQLRNPDLKEYNVIPVRHSIPSYC
jgi:hypothetical protein